VTALGALRWRLMHGLDVLAYRGLLPHSLAERRITRFWEDYARPIHETWGHDEADFAVLADILRRHGVRSVLDLGCGSGRLFDLYRAEGVTEILGVDIAAEALALARQEHPDVPTLQCRVEALPADIGQWDLVVSNRVLQHVQANEIVAVVGRISAAGRCVYINELSDTDPITEEFFMIRHDYPPLFAAQGYVQLAEGMLGRQTWRLFGAAREEAAS
jgi:SAM-dependent methyltransferase